MNDLRQYIHSTFNMGVDIDAAQYSDNNKLRLLDKEKYYIYITPIHFINHKNKQDEYKNHIIKATKTWSNALNNKNFGYIYITIFTKWTQNGHKMDIAPYVSGGRACDHLATIFSNSTKNRDDRN